MSAKATGDRSIFNEGSNPEDVKPAAANASTTKLIKSGQYHRGERWVSDDAAAHRMTFSSVGMHDFRPMPDIEVHRPGGCVPMERIPKLGV